MEAAWQIATAPDHTRNACNKDMSPETQFLDVTADGRPTRKVAYMTSPGGSNGAPGLVWLSGFKSDMVSTKASALAVWAEGRGVPYLRFD